MLYSMSMKENKVEAHFKWQVARLGGKTYKFTSPAQRGVADQIACLPNGETWFVELKAPSGRLSKLQKLFAEDMELLGQRYACLWSIEQINEWVESLGAEWLH
jgi:hypothetical protein